MKRIFTILLAVMLFASMATITSAASTTTLTTTVPAATYTLNIPADQQIKYGVQEKMLGALSVTNAVGFAQGKNLSITLTYDAFKCEEVSTRIPFSVSTNYTLNGQLYDVKVPSGSAIVFKGQSDGTLSDPSYNNGGVGDFNGLKVNFYSTDWSKALAGEYTATITFTAEVVAG